MKRMFLVGAFLLVTTAAVSQERRSPAKRVVIVFKDSAGEKVHVLTFTENRSL